MGLDITAYRKLIPAPDAPVDGDGCPLEYERFGQIHPSSIAFAEEHWPGRSAGITAGVYEPAEAFSFRAGSYGRYNQWRRQLAAFAGYDSLEVVWDTHPTGPFVELIDFADNEGVIGPVVSAKLAKDFDEHQWRADRHPDDWFRTQYGNWRKAFEMATDGGAVDFH